MIRRSKAQFGVFELTLGDSALVLGLGVAQRPVFEPKDFGVAHPGVYLSLDFIFVALVLKTRTLVHPSAGCGGRRGELVLHH